MNKIWGKYSDVITRRCTDETVSALSVMYWQNRMFAFTVMFIIPFSFIGFIPGIYVAIIQELYGLALVDLAAIITVLTIAFAPGLTVFTRKVIFNSTFYVVSLALLIYLGSFGPGLLYLLGVTIFILLSMDRKFGYFAIGANMFICTIIGLLIFNGWGNFEILNEYSVETWIAVSSNLIVLSITSVLIIPVLFKGLESALMHENELRSDLEETNHLLEVKNRELENFAYTASHDLKEPLRMIRSFMELLEKKYGPQLDEKAKEYIHYAVDGARRMTDSLNALLEYSRIGRIYDQQVNVDMNSILNEVKKTLQADVEKMNAQITALDLPEITAVPVSMKILIQNLISNALKYQNNDISVPPSISIAHSEDKEKWTFSVEDNGIGIEPKYHDQIFEMFKRLHGRQEYEGNGIGLALCKKVVEQHGGNIWVESEQDKGSTFHFTIKKEVS